MATGYTAAEVLDLLGEFELSGSDSDEEDDYGVSAYRGNPSIDPEEVQALGRAVTSERPASPGGGAGPSTVASAFLDSSDDGGMEEDSQGKNKH